MKIRQADRSDYDELALIMFEAVRQGSSSYSEEQRAAWVPEIRHGDEWNARLDRQSVFVAESDALLCGFLSCDADGYIDLAFVRPSAQKQGVFRRLYEQVELHARQAELKRLWVHASFNAFPAFTATGFNVVEEQTVEIRGQRLKRYEMEKFL